MADGMLERIEKLESNVRSSLSQLRHLQQLSEAELKREALGNLEQIRREISDVVSRMASLAEVSSLKEDLNKVFSLIGNPNEASFSGSPIVSTQVSMDGTLVERLAKKVKACEEKLDKLQASVEAIYIRSKVEHFEERLNGFELALTELKRSESVKAAGDDAQKSNNAVIFDDEPVEWG